MAARPSVLSAVPAGCQRASARLRRAQVLEAHLAGPAFPRHHPSHGHLEGQALEESHDADHAHQRPQLHGPHHRPPPRRRLPQEAHPPGGLQAQGERLSRHPFLAVSSAVAGAANGGDQGRRVSRAGPARAHAQTDWVPAGRPPAPGRRPTCHARWSAWSTTPDGAVTWPSSSIPKVRARGCPCAACTAGWRGAAAVGTGRVLRGAALSVKRRARWAWVRAACRQLLLHPGPPECRPGRHPGRQSGGIHPARELSAFGQHPCGRAHPQH